MPSGGGKAGCPSHVIAQIHHMAITSAPRLDQLCPSPSCECRGGPTNAHWVDHLARGLWGPGIQGVPGAKGEKRGTTERRQGGNHAGQNSLW